jgi:molybdate transport system substrate-binding protein
VVLALCLAAAAVGCGTGEADTPQLVVSAASSLAEVVTRLAARYREVDPSVAIVTNLAASGTLLQQIRQGAGVDVFLSASDREMSVLRDEALVEPGSVTLVASNELVMAVPAEAAGPTEMAELSGPAVARVALGAPASVPAGEYGREMLLHLGLWEAVQGKVVFASSVRHALAYAESGEVDAALVYRTDALRSRRVRVAAVAPAGSHSPIRYSAAVVAASENAPAARRFVAFVSGEEGAAIFRELGFAPAATGEGN